MNARAFRPAAAAGDEERGRGERAEQPESSSHLSPFATCRKHTVARARLRFAQGSVR